MSSFRRAFWRYPLFQIPLMFLSLCLIAALLCWLLGLGRPKVAVAIALDLSTSTYGTQFNAPGTIMYQEVQAVQSYLAENAQLRNANQVQILGFGGVVQSLTGNEFKTDSKQVSDELTQALQNPDLPQLVANNTTDINAAIQKGTEALSGVSDRCRELLLVTDGGANVSPNVVSNAVARKVKVNAIVVGADSPELKLTAFTTGGIYASGETSNLQRFFTERFFTRFNSNRQWIILWLGAAWIALMWMLTLILDKFIFQGLFKLPMNLSGQLSLGNALFWSVLTPIIIWQIWKILDLPFFSSC
ncbi:MULTISPECIES: vWA domain-containing protein [Cyanophyceae]|uniref:vWA domain-containing protein n=1 Tax=Cyanophyceae TaxID=3028117 RepID=UPI0016835E02|nr:vWA domain-containing protein [Trichocoleus sp. FACHB-40]MBD2003790.1 VWA domain-containing protein [Trichocoleus sp. FACHB-40]